MALICNKAEPVFFPEPLGNLAQLITRIAIVFPLLLMFGCTNESPSLSSAPSPPSVAGQPSPKENSYEKVVNAARLAQALGKMPQDTLDDRRRIVEAGGEALRLATEAVACDTLVVVELRPASVETYFRPLMRLFYSGAIVADADGQVQKAANYGLDLVRLGNAIGNGGYVMDHEIRRTCILMGCESITSVVDRLPTGICRSLTTDLAKESESLEPAELAHGRTLEKERQAQGNDQFEVARNVGALDKQLVYYRRGQEICCAAIALCRTKLAIRVYVLEKQRLPESLQELVGSVLPELPKDPWHSEGLIYRRDGNSYLLYSVGPDGIDDGGKQVPTGNLQLGRPGDFVQ